MAQLTITKTDPNGEELVENTDYEFDTDGNLTIMTAKAVTISGSDKTIKVKSSNNSKLNDVDITIDNLQISINSNNVTAFSLDNVNATLTLVNENSLHSGKSSNGLNISNSSSLIIQGAGKLKTSTQNWANGIGGNGSLIIKSGIIEANSGDYYAGINLPDIRIEGGYIKANGHDGGAGIGGGNNNSCGKIVITGGYIEATSSAYWQTPNVYGSSIGDSYNTSSSTSSIEISGNAIIEATHGIVANTITKTSGIIYISDNDYQVVGTVTLGGDYGGKALGTNGKTLVIPEGAKLIIPEGVTFTNNGTIKCYGEIEGNVAGNTPKIPLKKADITVTNPEYTGTAANPVLSVKGVTLTSNDYTINCSAVDAGEATAMITPKGNYFGDAFDITFAILPKALTVKLNNTITKKYDGTAKIDNPPVALEGVYKNEVSLANYTLSFQDAKAGNDKTLTIPAFALAANAKSKNYTITQPTGWTGTIEKVMLIVKPFKDEIIYKGEAIAYEVEGAVNSEKPEFTGALKVESGKVVNDNLDLKDEYKMNYTFKLESNVTITDNSSIEAKDVVVSLPAADGEKSWYKNKVTFTAPDGFEIALTDNQLKSDPVYAASFDWETEGSYLITYSLQRTMTKSVYTHTADILLDKTGPEVKGSPIIDNLNATFTLADATSGIASYSYVLDGGNKVEKTVTDAAKEVQVKLSEKEGTHTIAFTIQDVAGWETKKEISFELKSVPYVPPVVTYYTVTLPEVEGAMTTPKAGSHTVEEGYSFSFSLKLEAGYEQSVPVVTAGGKTIEPRASDGKYIIRNIYKDTKVSISGIVKNTPTRNAVIDAGTSIRTAGNTLLISVPQPVRAWVTNIGGIPVRILDLTAGENRVDGLRQGVYIINIAGEKGKKVMIR